MTTRQAAGFDPMGPLPKIEFHHTAEDKPLSDDVFAICKWPSELSPGMKVIRVNGVPFQVEHGPADAAKAILQEISIVGVAPSRDEHWGRTSEPSQSALPIKAPRTRQIGMFQVAADMLRNDTLLQHLSEALAGVVIVRAEHHFDRNVIEYVGLCSAFDEVPLGQKPPRYHMQITTHFKDNMYSHMTCTWKKIT